jgi:cytidine deaminase
MDDKVLVKEAIAARERAYSPYSNFMVGAALLTKSGKVYQGCNIENAAYTPSSCAERTAFFRAIYDGEREFTAIAVVGWPKGSTNPGLAFPCGVCRQVMIEFCDPDTFRIIVASGEDTFVSKTLAELLPNGFGPHSL